MIDVKNILITDEELAKCVEFSEKSAENQQAVEFGQKSTKARGVKEIARDNLIGKIAEVAFSKMMKENYGLDVPLDFNYYPRGKWDDQDAVINDWRIDVKGTRKGGHWMLIEWSKLNFRQKDDNLSHVYAMFSVEWDRETDTPTGKVAYEGAASLNKLRSECPTTQIIRKGELLPGTNTRMQADNFGIEFKDLYKHLNHLVSYLCGHKPPKSITDNYPNPFSGKTTLQVNEEKRNRKNTVSKECISVNKKKTKKSPWKRNKYKTRK